MLKIDIREKSQELITELILRCDKNNVPYSMETLTVGDYLWDDSICIELKRIDDFEKSMISKHLDSQLIAMQQYPHKLLLIYGELYSVNRRRTAMSRKQFQAKLLSIATRDGIPYHHVPSLEDAIDVIFACRENIQDKGVRVEEVMRHPSLPGGKENPSLALFYALKGVGLQKAHALHEHYGSFATFITEFKQNTKKLDDGLISKKEFMVLYPASLVNKTTKDYLLQL